MKNRKLKTSAKLLLFILLILLVIIVFLLFKKDDKKDTKKTNNNEQTENNNKKEKPSEPVKPKNKYEDGKYYLEKNLERYENYDNANPGLCRDEVIKRVNSGLDKTWYVDVEPTDLSKGNLVIVNKLHYVDQNFEPDNLVSMSGYGNGYLVKDAHDAYVELYNAAKADGMNLIITTSYRNYGFQSTLYYNYVNRDGQESADTYSARPGYSEHHTGLAVDLSTPSLTNAFTEFIYTDEYKWMQNNCYKYGFIQRYTDENQYITGYQPEAWHYRYVGKDVAKYIYENNITYEEYYAYFVEK
ncbi:MAG: M15 family metallopeptidase [Bacilli bacterium]|nr:M15 family metallopeptidase [Bacilli bacterium]